MIRVLSLVFAILVIAVEGSGQDLESPRLQAVRNALAFDSGSAVESFWKGMAETRAPLIERLDEHQGYALVTFVWRGESGTEHVFVDGQLGQLTGTRLTDNALTQLAGTNVWYRSHWLRNDLRTIYRFVVGAEGNERSRYYPDPLRLDGAPPSLLIRRTISVWNGRFWSCLVQSLNRGLPHVPAFRPAERSRKRGRVRC